MFFKHCTRRSAAQRHVVLRRTYPWFQPGYRLFEKEPEEEEARTEFRKKFLSVTLPWDLPFGGGKPPNYHLGAEVYHPNFCARQLGCPQLIPLKSYRSCNWATSWRDLDDLEVHKNCKCSVNKFNNSVDALYPSLELNSCSSAEFNAWWKARFHSLPASISATKVLFDGWNSWTVYARAKAKQFMVQMIKDINGQVIEDPSITKSIGGQDVQVGEVIAESAPPPPTRSKRLRKRAVVEYVATKSAVAPTTTSGTDEELREAFEVVEQEKKAEVLTGDKEEGKEVEEEEAQKAEPTRSELALLDDVEVEHSAVVLDCEVEAEHSVAIPEPEVEEDKTAGVLTVVISLLKPPIVAMPIHSVLGSSTTASFADPKLAEFEVMDLDAQLDKLEKLGSAPGKAKSKAMDRMRIWQSNELDLDENKKAID
ncbi:unnamed protein product [Prunus armeniaca]